MEDDGPVENINASQSENENEYKITIIESKIEECDMFEFCSVKPEPEFDEEDMKFLIFGIKNEVSEVQLKEECIIEQNSATFSGNIDSAPSTRKKTRPTKTYRGAEQKTQQTDSPLQSLLYKCHVCGRTYETEICLKAHMLFHRNLKFETCPVCSDIFETKDMLVEHMAVHVTLRNV